MPSEPLISVRGLTRRFADHAAVADVSFELLRGEAVALVGESGSGKSTIARCLSGLLPPTSGTITTRARVQMIFQDPFASLNPVHTIRYTLSRPLALHRSRATIDSLLQLVGLSPDLAAKHPHQLSGGQRQRVAIARALATDPDVLLADEPTSMLDASIRIEILNLLLDLKSRGISLLLITHDLASARYLADRILVMHHGRIVESGDARTIIGAPSHPYTRRLLAAAT